ncbi:MAG TPA: hypothetical protein VGI14_09200 [Casimicrobiaceae bacterium]
MHAAQSSSSGGIDSTRYARSIEASKRIRWDIDKDVIRGRQFAFDRKFLPDALSKVDELAFLTPAEARLLSQIQGRTYANTFGLVERFIAAKVLDVSRDHGLGDQSALEALVRFADEEIKHQALFRRVERMSAAGMPDGYVFLAEPNAVASAVLSKSTWAVLALTCHIELFVLAHYRESIGPTADIDDTWKDVFLFHWKEESQHAILDELEWRREDARVSDSQRDQAVTDLIDLVGAVDGILQMQAPADAAYFVRCAGRAFTSGEAAAIRDVVLRAYRWQYIVSGVQQPRFVDILRSLVSAAQMQRIAAALASMKIA